MTKNRNNHTGKNKVERELYAKIINSSGGIDKTEERKTDIAPTNSSTFEEKDDQKSKKIKKRTTKLTVQDFLRENFLIAILVCLLGGVILYLFQLYSSSNRELGEIKTKNEYIEKNIEKMVSKYDDLSEKYNGMNVVIENVKSDLRNLNELFQQKK